MAGEGREQVRRRRSAARLAAVQALYQIELSGGEPDVEGVILEFLTHRLGGARDDEERFEADSGLFQDLVRGAVRRRGGVDRLIRGALTERWPLQRLEAVLRALLRCGTYELAMHPEIPPKVTIAEYVALAHDFFGGDEPGLANAVLDRIGRELRSGELGGMDDGADDETR